MAAGVEGDGVYQQEAINLKVGDYLLMYTDGVTDAQMGETNFGDDRLKEAALSFSTLPAVELVKRLEKVVCDFSGSGDPVDDVTMLIAKKIA